MSAAPSPSGEKDAADAEAAITTGPVVSTISGNERRAWLPARVHDAEDRRVAAVGDARAVGAVPRHVKAMDPPVPLAVRIVPPRDAISRAQRDGAGRRHR